LRRLGAGFVHPTNNSYRLEPVSIHEVVNRLGINILHEVGITGKGVRIGIIDSGVYENHPDLRNNIRFYESLADDGDKKDYIGHGTHVAGIVKAFAPDSELYVVKVIGKKGICGLDRIISALSILYHRGVNVINMSLGADVNCCVSSISLMINMHKDTVHVASIGNEDGERATCMCPAMIPRVIAVGSVDPVTFEPAEFTSRGPGCFGSHKPLVVAPGGSLTHCIVSTFSPDAMNGAGHMYACMSGTSQASPMIAGLIALIIQFAREHGEYVDLSDALIELAGGKYNIVTGYGIPRIKSRQSFIEAIHRNIYRPKGTGSMIINTIMIIKLIEKLLFR